MVRFKHDARPPHEPPPPHDARPPHKPPPPCDACNATWHAPVCFRRNHGNAPDEDPTTWLDNGRRLEEMLTQQNAIKVEYGPSPDLRFGCTLTVDLQRRILEVPPKHSVQLSVSAVACPWQDLWGPCKICADRIARRGARGLLLLGRRRRRCSPWAQLTRMLVVSVLRASLSRSLILMRRRGRAGRLARDTPASRAWAWAWAWAWVRPSPISAGPTALDVAAVSHAHACPYLPCPPT